MYFTNRTETRLRPRFLQVAARSQGSTRSISDHMSPGMVHAVGRREHELLLLAKDATTLDLLLTHSTGTHPWHLLSGSAACLLSALLSLRRRGQKPSASSTRRRVADANCPSLTRFSQKNGWSHNTCRQGSDAGIQVKSGVWMHQWRTSGPTMNSAVYTVYINATRHFRCYFYSSPANSVTCLIA